MRVFSQEGLTLDCGGGVGTWSYQGTELWTGTVQRPGGKEIVEGLDEALHAATSDMWWKEGFVQAATAAVQTFDPMRTIAAVV